MPEEVKSAFFDLPALDLSVAFLQAIPASIFPPSVSDYYEFDDLLTLEEQVVRKRVRECMEKEVAPIMVMLVWSWISLKARETVSLGRELLGGNGI